MCDAGVEFIQFIPVVERLADETAARDGLKLHAPGDIQGNDGWSVRPDEFGEFLVAIFDHWIKRDGKIFVMNIEWAFANFVGAGCGLPSSANLWASVIVEHNGDVYACDHYVYPQWLGICISKDLETIDFPQQQVFGEDKFEQLPAQCRSCNVLKACWGRLPETPLHARCQRQTGAELFVCRGISVISAIYRHILKQWLICWRTVARPVTLCMRICWW